MHRYNTGLFSLNTMILAMGVFCGGIAQVIAGIMEFRKGTTFGATAFCSHGLFWLTLVGLLVFPAWGMGEAPDATATGWYSIMWGASTGLMFVATLKTDRALQTVFSSSTAPFVLLALTDRRHRRDERIAMTLDPHVT